jgi:hypothetical protein
MAYFLIKFEGNTYANWELYMDAIAGGERALIKMVANKTITGKMLFDQTLYPLSDEQKIRCAEYSPIEQDFDKFFKHLNIISKESIRQIKQGNCSAFPGATLITVRAETVPEQYKYRQATFFKASGYKEAKKYRMLLSMAAIKICGRIYVALNTVNVQVKQPILVTLKD